ncbi:MAG: hypothetical protein QNJ53_28210 [Pleurocapsa sp. MO_192.B19]|nr:hypothetical protein [Pleurocapsa sp. MO_192.B19]
MRIGWLFLLTCSILHFDVRKVGYIVSRPSLGYSLGSLGDDPTSQVIIEGVNIDDLGGRNFIFLDAV